MPLPYYLDKNKPNQPDFPYQLFIDDIRETIGHIIDKNIGLLPSQHLRNIAAYYHIADSAIYNYQKGIINWKRTIEIYFELIKIVAGLGEFEKMIEIYSSSILHINEGQQALFHIEDQLKATKEKDWQVRFNCLLEKYHTIYEGNIRYSLILAVYCLDKIADHNDGKTKSIEKYFNDDVSYHIKKISQCKNFTFVGNLDYLVMEVEAHIRNAISHKQIEYGDEHNVILSDREWKAEFKLGEFERIIETINISCIAQITALILFAYEFKEKFDSTRVRSYLNLKQLRILVDHEIRSSFLVSKDIRFEKDNTLIVCDIEKSAGFDYPSETFIGYHGIGICSERPTLNLEDQILKVIYYIANLNTDFIECRFNVFKYDGKQLGSIVVSLNGATELVKGNDWLGELKKKIVLNTLKDETD